MNLADIKEVLDAVVVDVWGAVDRKLPRCPACGDDELWCRAFDFGLRFRCYRCNWLYDAPTRGAGV